MLTNTRISLDGAWTLHYVENKRYKTEAKDVSTIAAVKSTGWKSVDAVVPGNFELDFQRAGLIGDPYYGTNFIDNYKFEYLHLIYSRSFELDYEPDENTILHFDGIDTIADIYVNGRLIGQTDNMLVPFDFTNANLHKGMNEIVIHITPARIAARQYPMAPSSVAGGTLLAIRKAPHMIGWDILPRIITGGIWRPCYIEQKRPDRIDDIYFYVHSQDVAKNFAQVGFVYNVTMSEDEAFDYTLTIEGSCGDSSFRCGGKLWDPFGRMIANVNNAKFWWPRNYGEPNLYDITATLCYKGEPVYEYKMSEGIRTIRLDRTSTTDEAGSGEFCFYINGKKIFWHGTNWVPVDAFHSRDAERLPEILPMLTDLNCNCVRCWGGNVYEDDIFFDFCDRNGIMVWQDFAHACAVNPQDDEYCARFYAEVEKIVKRLRNRTSIILWAGDNEVDACYQWSWPALHLDPNKNRLTRKVIPSVLEVQDFTRPYLPSSPYYDEKKFATGMNSSEEHLWGPRDYFKGEFYGKSVCHFASETGYHGCPSPASMKKFIHPDQLWHWKTAPDNNLPKPDWCAHAACAATDGSDGNVYRIGLMSNQVKTLFPAFREDEAAMGLDKFARASQISQAEAKKYFIERFRVTKWRRTGIIWWNLIDGWPQISDAVVDYYGSKKLAYHYIKRSQQQLCMIFDEPKNDQLPLHVVSDHQTDVNVKYTVTDLTTGEKLIESECVGIANTSRLVWYKQMTKGEKHFYFIEWEYEKDGQLVKGCNHYVSNIRDIDYDEYIGYMKQCGFYEEFVGFDE
ncbi:MAG: hypothetical protein IJ493_12360 [Clostridia bacterium]|nr:hypothetical protein [Clostridia bacterium]